MYLINDNLVMISINNDNYILNYKKITKLDFGLLKMFLFILMI